MPPALLIDLNSLDLSKVLFDAAEIEKVNPHRFEMRQLDGIIHMDNEQVLCVGYKDVTEREFWVRGHIPGRPIMPGVVIVEAAAQLASFHVIKAVAQSSQKFIGFGGIDKVKFRGAVVPVDRLYLVVKLIDYRPRRFICAAQGFVKNQMVFEAEITGMPI